MLACKLLCVVGEAAMGGWGSIFLESELKQAGVSVGVIYCAKCTSAYGTWERSLRPQQQRVPLPAQLV